MNKEIFLSLQNKLIFSANEESILNNCLQAVEFSTAEDFKDGIIPNSGTSVNWESQYSASFSNFELDKYSFSEFI